MHDRVSHVQLSAASIRRSLAGVCTLANTLIAAIVLTAVVPANAQLTSIREEAATARTDAIVSVNLKQSKVTWDEHGVEHLMDATTLKPGDVVEYRVAYTNNSKKSVSGLIADLPIPEGMEYVPKSAKPGAQLSTVATKDGQYGSEPLQRKGMGKKDESIPYNEYRAIRWQLGQLPAGGVAEVSARAKVETAAKPASTAPMSVTR